METIIAALFAGATAATKDAAGTAVKDAYEGLKTLIKRKFSGNEAAKVVLDEHEKDPEAYEVPLKKKLTEAGVDKDQEILKAAEKIMEIMEKKAPPDAAAGNYSNTVAGDMKTVVQGNMTGGTINSTIS